ncbi:aldehyde dehydrogenase family protein, partial [Amycolatopsis magusensis]|uniref:aldehyde dehydrogenase family protein n=1 Tax=Amycolatopsis magusensis TaxID=882444 RepID=UPI0024A9B51C
EAQWQGKVFTGGWESTGADGPVTEPATGAELGRYGLADPAAIARSAERAAQAQRDWAARPFQERAAVLRRAGRLWEEHA